MNILILLYIFPQNYKTTSTRLLGKGYKILYPLANSFTTGIDYESHCGAQRARSRQREKEDDPEATTSQTCKDIEAQIYVGLERAAENRERWREYQVTSVLVFGLNNLVMK